MLTVKFGEGGFGRFSHHLRAPCHRGTPNSCCERMVLRTFLRCRARGGTGGGGDQEMSKGPHVSGDRAAWDLLDWSPVVELCRYTKDGKASWGTSDIQ